MNISLPEHVASISTGTIVRFFVVGILLWAMYYLSDILLVILASIVIASAVQPFIRRISRLGIHRTISVIIIYVVIVAILASILIFFMPIVMNDTLEFLGSIPQTISLGDLWSPVSTLSDSASSVSHMFYITDFRYALRSFLLGTTESAAALQTVSHIFGGLFSFVLMVVLSFYLAVKEDGVDSFVKLITPIKRHEDVLALWHRSQRKMALWLQGQVILGITVGVLVYISLVIIGVPHAILLAVLAAVLEIIPIFGPIIAAVPAIVLVFANMGNTTGFIVVAVYILIHQLENHIIYPLVVRRVVGISPVIVIIALIIGAKLAGVLGALVAVPLAAAFGEYVSSREKRRVAEHAAGNAQ